MTARIPALAAGAVLRAMVMLRLFLGRSECPAAPADQGTPGPAARIRVEPGHPWRPPFGLDRIGRPLDAVVEITEDQQPRPALWLVELRDGKELTRHALAFDEKAPLTARVALDAWPSELRLVTNLAPGEPVGLATLALEPAPFEAEAVARAEPVVNPVDLGAILVPSNWLLLGDGQTGTVEVAAISRAGDVTNAQVAAWFQSQPERAITAVLNLTKDRRGQLKFRLPSVPPVLVRDVLHVSVKASSGAELWHTQVPAMLVPNVPARPEFGAIETRLRYDAPISVRADDGTFSPMSFDQGWDPRLHDVVVFLPNGARFVFWRGSSYVPFWAGRHNTGLSYEWAETSPPQEGYADCVEPLMDKELRYGRVQIVESTPAHVHVRWSYQSCDFKYKVWGDSAVEDFHFYRDGFGTRVLTLQSVPTGDYELSEFIILTPQETYPFSVLPPNLVDMLFVDGQKRELRFPFFPNEPGDQAASRDLPAIYRVRFHKDEPMAAVYFNPLDRHVPPVIFAPFFDQGQLVTPCYWGSHWPLARGKTTGWAIDDRVHFTPCHNSVMSWARSRPKPLRTAQFETLDTLGRSKPMLVQTWVWLIGLSDADDPRLLAWAQSFSHPPLLELQGARLEAESYLPERRAMRLVVEDQQVTMTIKPVLRCINPVFELTGMPGSLASVHLADRRLGASDYAWDGRTLWINATLTLSTPLRLDFSERR